MRQTASSAVTVLLLLAAAVGIYYGIEHVVHTRVEQAGGHSGPSIEALWRLDLFAFVIALAAIAISEVMAFFKALRAGGGSHVSGWRIFGQCMIPIGVLVVTVLLVEGLRGILPAQ